MPTMEKHGILTWLDYYHAVKRGDLKTVQKAKDKDFRITLTMDKSAIELAALYGHNELLDYFLMRVDKKIDEQLLFYTLREALRGGRIEIVKKLSAFIPLNEDEEPPMDLYMAAFTGGHFECLQLINSKLEPRRSMKDIYFQEVFYNVGSVRMLKFLMKIYKIESVEEIAPHIGVPSHFVNIALNLWEPLLNTIKTMGDWHKRVGLWTPMDIAAMFGRLEILKLMVNKMDSQKMLYFHRNMSSTITYALRTDRTNILEYLIEYGLAGPGQPCEYPGFEINDAFYYLKKVRQDIKVDLRRKGNAFVENFADGLEVIHGYPDFDLVIDKLKPLNQWSTDKDRSKYWTLSSCASKTTKIEDFYEYLVERWKRTTEVSDPDFEALFMRALTEQNVDAALVLLKLTKGLMCTSMKLCRHILNMMYSPPRKYGFVPSPVVLEIILKEVMKGEKSCRCGCQVNLMNCFMTYSVTTSQGRQPDFSMVHDQNLPLQLHVKRAAAILDLLLNYGYAKPRHGEVNDLIRNLFSMDDHWSLGAAHVLCLLQCCHIGDSLNHTTSVVNFDRRDSSRWFGNNAWPQRNEFLTEFLIAISRNRWYPAFSLRGAMLYTARPKNRREHFKNCREKTRVYLHDERLEEMLDNELAGDEILTKELIDCNDDQAQTLPSLQECARFAIHAHYLRQCASKPYYVSVKEIIHRISQDLPTRLGRFLEFRDVYDTLDFEDEGRADDVLNPGNGNGYGNFEFYGSSWGDWGFMSDSMSMWGNYLEDDEVHYDYGYEHYYPG